MDVKRTRTLVMGEGTTEKTAAGDMVDSLLSRLPKLFEPSLKEEKRKAFARASVRAMPKEEGRGKAGEGKGRRRRWLKLRRLRGSNGREVNVVDVYDEGGDDGPSAAAVAMAETLKNHLLPALASQGPAGLAGMSDAAFFEWIMSPDGDLDQLVAAERNPWDDDEDEEEAGLGGAGGKGGRGELGTRNAYVNYFVGQGSILLDQEDATRALETYGMSPFLMGTDPWDEDRDPLQAYDEADEDLDGKEIDYPEEASHDSSEDGRDRDEIDVWAMRESRRDAEDEYSDEEDDLDAYTRANEDFLDPDFDLAAPPEVEMFSRMARAFLTDPEGDAGRDHDDDDGAFEDAEYDIDYSGLTQQLSSLRVDPTMYDPRLAPEDPLDMGGSGSYPPQPSAQPYHSHLTRSSRTPSSSHLRSSGMDDSFVVPYEDEEEAEEDAYYYRLLTGKDP